MSGGNFIKRASSVANVSAAADGPSAGGNAALDNSLDEASQAGARAEARQRLHIGLAGLGAMVLLIALASVLGNQADLTEQGAVPEAAPTTEPTVNAPQRDPLVDAGIVPDLPADQGAAAQESPERAPQAGVDDTSAEIVEDVAPDTDAPVP